MHDQPNGATRSLDGLRVPIPAPTTDAERYDLNQWQGELDSALSANDAEGTPVAAALLALHDELLALTWGTTPERAEHHRAAYALWGWAEAHTEGLHNADMDALMGTRMRQAGAAPRTLPELRKLRAAWTADRERFERWLDRAECLLEPKGDR